MGHVSQDNYIVLHPSPYMYEHQHRGKFYPESFPSCGLRGGGGDTSGGKMAMLSEQQPQKKAETYIVHVWGISRGGGLYVIYTPRARATISLQHKHSLLFLFE